MADTSRLIACLMDVERHVSSAGWDQPARLFALVTTGTLLEVEPQLRGRVPEASPDALTAIEQDEFHATDNVIERLGGIFWPETVEGCAMHEGAMMRIGEQLREMHGIESAQSLGGNLDTHLESLADKSHVERVGI